MKCPAPKCNGTIVYQGLREIECDRPGCCNGPPVEVHEPSKMFVWAEAIRRRLGFINAAESAYYAAQAAQQLSAEQITQAQYSRLMAVWRQHRINQGGE